MSDKRERDAARREERRREVLSRLCDDGDLRCACCPESVYAFLTVDHIHGGGVQDRKQRGHTTTWYLVYKEHKAGASWADLRQRYRVLCANCNQAKRVSRDGRCPHECAPTTRGTGFIMFTIPHELVKSYVKVFAATTLSLFLADGADVFGVSWGDLRTWLAAGLASVLPLIITALDASDPRWGRTK